MTKLIKKLLCLLLLLVINTSMQNDLAYAAEPTQQVTPSGIPYGELGQKIEDYIKENQAVTASVAIEVFDGQDTIYQTVTGYTNLKDQVKANKDTVYEWGSCSKLLVWTSVMQLWEQGKLDLEADIRTYLPKGFLKKTKYDTPITMLNLMNHTAGWQETIYEIATKDESHLVDLEQALKQSEPSQIYQPGTVCAYSNWGNALAGYIVECITGQTFYEYVHDHIFEPLGMEHTAYAADLSDNPWVYNQRQELNCYSITKDNTTELGKSFEYILLYPAGMATGTLDDFTAFAKAFLPKEGESSPLFEKAGTLDTMLSPTLFYGNSDLARVCHGMWTMAFGVELLGHGGNTSGGSSYLLFDPVSKLGVTVMTNQSGEYVYNYGIPALVFGAYSADSVGSSEDLKNLNGAYTSSRTLRKGFVSFYDVLSVMLLKSAKDAPNKLDFMMEEGSITQVMGNNYVADLDGPKLFMYKNSTGNGKVSFQMMSQDFIRQNSVAYFAKVGLILLLLLGCIFSLVCLVIELIVWLVRKIRRKTVIPQPMKKYRILTHISMVAFAAIIFSFLTSSVFIVGTIWWRCILSAFLALIPVLYIVILFLNRKLVQSSRKMKFYNFLTALWGLIMSINVMFWQTYNFWS